MTRAPVLRAPLAALLTACLLAAPADAARAPAAGPAPAPPPATAAPSGITVRRIAGGLHEGGTYGTKLRADGAWLAYGVRERNQKGDTRSLFYARSLVEDSSFRTVWPNEHPAFKPKEGPNSFSDLVGFEWHPDGVHNAMIARHKQEGDDVFIEDMKLRFGGEGNDEQAFFTRDGAFVVATVRSPLGTDLWYAAVAPGSRPEQLTWTRDFERWPDWHPTERRILHEMYDRKQGELFTFAIEGFAQTPFLQLPGSDEVRPTWSPDGTRYAYLSDRAAPGSKRYDLYVSAVGRDDATRVIADVRLSDDSRSYCWDPDGRYLLAISNDGAAGFPFLVAAADGSGAATRVPIDVVDNLDPALARIAPVEGAPPGPALLRLVWVAPDPERRRGDAAWRIVYAADVPEALLLALVGKG